MKDNERGKCIILYSVAIIVQDLYYNDLQLTCFTEMCIKEHNKWTIKVCCKAGLLG